MTSAPRWGIALLFPLVAGPVWCLAWNGQAGRLGTLAGLVLVSALITAAVTDFRRHRIYNWTTYPAFLWAVGINIVAYAATYGSESFLPSFAPAGIVGPQYLGGVGLGECLAGAAVTTFPAAVRAT